MTRLVNAVLMLDAMALFCCWRSANGDASPLGENAMNGRAWMGDVLCSRHYYYSCAWWAKGEGYDGIDCHCDGVLSRWTYDAAVLVPQPVHCDCCQC